MKELFFSLHSHIQNWNRSMQRPGICWNLSSPGKVPKSPKHFSSFKLLNVLSRRFSLRYCVCQLLIVSHDRKTCMNVSSLIESRLILLFKWETRVLVPSVLLRNLNKKVLNPVFKELIFHKSKIPLITLFYLPAGKRCVHQNSVIHKYINKQ